MSRCVLNCPFAWCMRFSHKNGNLLDYTLQDIRIHVKNFPLFLNSNGLNQIQTAFETYSNTYDIWSLFLCVCGILYKLEGSSMFHALILIYYCFELLNFFNVYLILLRWFSILKMEKMLHAYVFLFVFVSDDLDLFRL